MSKAILTGLLREKLGFKGLIITDCLEMEAIQGFYGTADGAVEAVKAGAQLLCICHTPRLVMEAIHKIEAAVASGEIPMELIDAAVANVLKYKAIYKIDKSFNNPSAIGCEEHKKAVEEMTLAGITQVSKGLLPDITPDTLFLGSYAYRTTLANSPVDMSLHFAEYMAGKMGCNYLDVSINPGSDEINDILVKIKQYSQIVYGLYNGHLNRGQITLAEEISRSGHSMLAVTLRNPYDFALLNDKIHKIALYEYNKIAFDALCKVLGKKAKVMGKLPVKLS